MSIIKEILAIFGIVGSATAEQNEESQRKLKKAISPYVNDLNSYTVLYGVSNQAGVTAIKGTSYAIGFNEQTGDMVISIFDFETGESYDSILISQHDAPKVSLRMKTQLSVQTDGMKSPEDIMIIYANRENASGLYQLPVNQQKEVEAFCGFIEKYY